MKHCSHHKVAVYYMYIWDNSWPHTWSEGLHLYFSSAGMAPHRGGGLKENYSWWTVAIVIIFQCMCVWVGWGGVGGVRERVWRGYGGNLRIIIRVYVPFSWLSFPNGLVQSILLQNGHQHTSTHCTHPTRTPEFKWKYRGSWRLQNIIMYIAIFKDITDQIAACKGNNGKKNGYSI